MGKKSKHSKKQWRGKEARQLAEEATQAAVRGAEQERLEQTVAAAPDAVLFFQDKGPAEVKIKVEEDPAAELRKLKLERARKRLPKGTSMFHQRPQGPADLLCPPLIPNQAPTTKKKDITKILEKLETSILKEKESGKAKTKSKKRSRNDFDVWETEKDVVKMPDNVKREYVEQTLIAPATKPKKRKLSAVSKISTINSTNSILHPLAGQSYRPDPMQHEETLAVAVAMEQRKRDEEDRIKRMMSYPSNLKGVIGSDILDGYNADQRDTSSDESDSDQSDNETKLETSARKTKKMRNKEKKKAQNELQRKLKEWKKRETQEYSKADQYVRDIESKKVALEARRKDRAAHRIKQRLLGIQPKRIGKVKYQKPGLDIALRDEIPNALRGVSAASSIGLLKTHYASLQERNVLVTPDLTKRVCKRRNVRVHVK